MGAIDMTLCDILLWTGLYLLHKQSLGVFQHWIKLPKTLAKFLAHTFEEIHF